MMIIKHKLLIAAIEPLYDNATIISWELVHIEAVSQRCSVKKVFLEVSQNSQENTCARVSLLKKLLAWGLQLY